MNWLKNGGTDLILLLLLPINMIVISILTIIDLFIPNQEWVTKTIDFLSDKAKWLYEIGHDKE